MRSHHSDDHRHGFERTILEHPAFIRVAGVFSIALFAASLFPSALVAVVLQEILLISGLAFATHALITRETFDNQRFNRWDEAALLAGIAILSGFFVDPEAARQTLEAMAGSTPGGTTERPLAS